MGVAGEKMKELDKKKRSKEKVMEQFRHQDEVMSRCLWVIATLVYLRGIVWIFRLSELEVNKDTFSLSVQMGIKIIACLVISLFFFLMLAAEDKEKQEKLLRGTRFVLRSVKVVLETMVVAAFFFIMGLLSTIHNVYCECVEYAGSRKKHYEKQELRREEWYEDINIEDYYIIEDVDCYE